MLFDLLRAAFLGIIEGFTEFLPISSTGHLILAEKLIRFEGPLAETFAIFIQLGAILAVVWFYKRELFEVVRGLPKQTRAQNLALNVFIAFLPAALIGLVIHKQIKAYLFNPITIAVALIVGGFLILWVEQKKAREKQHANLSISPSNIYEMSRKDALVVGIAQVFSLVPGASRSAATILGGMISGLDRKVATEFSFWLAIPTLLIATLFDFVTSLDLLKPDDFLVLAVGTVVSFIVALIVIKAFLRYVQTNTFQPFAYYRILLGLAILLVAWLAR